MVSATALGVPPAPTGLMARPLNTQVGLIWNPQPGAAGYRVLRATGSPSGFTTIASPSGAIYTDTGLANGTTYYYEVNATNSYGSSPNSAYVVAVPAFAPAGIALDKPQGRPAFVIYRTARSQRTRGR